MITIQVYCAQCGKRKDIELQSDSIAPTVELQSLINSAGWIVQYNKPYFDVYCSKRCAK